MSHRATDFNTNIVVMGVFILRNMISDGN
jgi:hypothetical protein